MMLDELAVNDYQRSSVLSLIPQEGSGDEWVEPVVFAEIELLQLAPKGCVVIEILLMQSSFAGGAGTF